MEADMNIKIGQASTTLGAMEIRLRIEGMTTPMVELTSYLFSKRGTPVQLVYDEKTFAVLCDSLLELRGVMKSLKEAMPEGRLPLPWVVQNPDLSQL